MCMPLDHRLQILLDDERYQRLSSAARARGVSVATIVREAIDRGVVDVTGRRQRAGRVLLDAPDMLVPVDLLDELNELRGRRLQ